MANHTILYDKVTGEVLVFGDNHWGQLGLGDYENRNVPTQLMIDKNIKHITYGWDHSIMYKESGDILVFGNNRRGQLGLSSYCSRDVPTLLVINKTIRNIVSGKQYTIIYKQSGEIFVLDYFSNQDNSIPLMTDKTIKDIIRGGNHTIFYKENGEVLVFGKNQYGQLGFDDDVDYNIPTVLMVDRNIEHISCGINHSIIYNGVTGEVLVFGDNNRGQLGLGYIAKIRVPTRLMIDKTIKKIVCGGHHTIIYNELGEIFVFGEGRDGQLGLGDYNHRNKPTLLGVDKTIKNIICGHRHTLIYQNSGQVIVFGANKQGQLGLGNYVGATNKPIELMINKNLHFFSRGIYTWSVENYKKLSPAKQEWIWMLYICLKRNQFLTGLKVPKFVIYEIVKCL
jgi:alpha-tubulin suppressor-like RCC1 family protein